MPNIRVRAELDSRNYRRGAGQVKRENRGIVDRLGGIKGMIGKAFAVGAVLTFARAVGRAIGQLVQFGSKLTDLAAQSGIDTTSLQRYEEAALNAGVGLEKVTNALARVKDAQGNVAAGGDEAKRYADAFTKLGISIEDVVNMRHDELFNRIAAAVTRSGNAAKEFSAVADIIGLRNAPQLTEVLNQVGTEFNRLGDDIGTVTDRNAQALDLMADKWGMFWRRLKGGAANVLGSILGGAAFNREIDKRLAQQGKMFDVEKRMRQQQAAESKRLADEEARSESQKAQTRMDRLQQEAEIRKAVFQTQGDEFRSIGGLIGNMQSRAMQEARIALEIEKSQQKHLAQIEVNTRQMGTLG